ncbi:MAG: ABC transporter permease [Saprospiraceae bacterium]
MKIYFRIIFESVSQALHALKSNILRTALSLLGITIGIFCIITVKSAVDSLQDSIIEGFNELGNDVIYLDRMPWNEDPSQNYWKYLKRPDPSYDDYDVIKRKSKLSKTAAFCAFSSAGTIKFESSSVSNAFLMGSTQEYSSIKALKLSEGRFLNPIEFSSGANKAILGYKVYQNLFGNINGVGKTIKVFGQNYQVIGYLESEGDNAFNFINFDEVIWISYNNMKRFINVGDNSTVGKMLAIQAKNGVPLDELKSDITGVIRAERRLKPLEKDNFSLNELSQLSQVLDKVFSVLNWAGFIIGIFALIVGMFSVANIMFVSVKERTNIIGIKKALGAKRYVILMEFLIESIILCTIGGFLGLLLVYLTLLIITSFLPFSMGMSLSNMLVGVVVSILVGVISGILPALQASGMNPVDAIRA